MNDIRRVFPPQLEDCRACDSSARNLLCARLDTPWRVRKCSIQGIAYMVRSWIRVLTECCCASVSTRVLLSRIEIA